MPITVIYDDDPVDLVFKADEALNNLLKETIIEEGRPVLLLLSGGSDLSLLRNIQNIDSELFSSALTVSTLDERFSRSPQENNFLQIVDTPFFQDAEDAHVRFIRTVPEERETLEEFAKRIEQELQDWHEVNRDGKIIVTQGIGSDGHTAGLNVTLEQEEFTSQFENFRWVVGYTSSKLTPPKRITVTTTFLRSMVDTSIMYVTGEDKAWALRELEKKEFKDELFTLPARIVYQMKNVQLFTDIDIAI